MAECSVCQREMTARVSCSAEPYPDGTPPILYGLERRFGSGHRPASHCPDCGTPIGGFHHAGCATEECPRCGAQSVECACYTDADVDDDTEPGLQ